MSILFPAEPKVSIAGPCVSRFAAGVSLYEEGDPAYFCFEVRAGVARTCRFHQNGDRHLVGFFFAGDVFGLDRVRRFETAEAVTDLEVVRHPHPGDRSGAFDGEALLEAALRATRSCVYLLGHRTAEQRVAAFLLTLSEKFGTQTEIPVPMSRTDIADHLRLTIHTVSRTISGLCRRKLIQLRGAQTFRIVNEPALRKLAGDGASHT